MTRNSRSASESVRVLPSTRPGRASDICGGSSHGKPGHPHQPHPETNGGAAGGPGRGQGGNLLQYKQHAKRPPWGLLRQLPDQESRWESSRGAAAVADFCHPLSGTCLHDMAPGRGRVEAGGVHVKGARGDRRSYTLSGH
eukprot:scaffold1318_cov388-Prasinococcus_capsulatus_cf.AAC.62